MKESSSTEPTSTVAAESFPGLRPAMVLGSVLLLGLGLSLAMVLRDNTRRTEMEVIVESTAVGDSHYVKVPDPLPEEPFPAIAHLQGKPLIPSSYKRHEKREADMQPVAKDEATGLTIYVAPVKAKDVAAKEAGEAPTYFLKAGPGEFLKVRPTGKAAEE